MLVTRYVRKVKDPSQNAEAKMKTSEDHAEGSLINIGLKKYFGYVISAEDVKKYKPSPEPYILASNRLGIPISDICLVSSNLWDIAGGQAAGMQTCWINRGEEVEASKELDVKPDYVFDSIEKIKDLVVRSSTRSTENDISWF